ncbi:HNH endonuclease [Ectobacillus ponti]|uniref:Putative HNH nuclease YajD n=1 Tax=Ectobacillus ponti TaxID=2961894 RepID=A0AA41X7Y4_9BACI|nr:HNH endonuclease signature motif containing protein [Ectobacillus ponti]MCP8970559.1 HNH endonuclease [Ectobacillus ponti]
MPRRPLKVCSHPGCAVLSPNAYCEQHSRDRRPAEQNRQTAHQRGYNSRWRKARATYLSRQPLCVHCLQAGMYTSATVVDHIVPHKGDSALFWDKTNWQPLCKRCHDIKTVTEDGGFGKPVKERE